MTATESSTGILHDLQFCAKRFCVFLKLWFSRAAFTCMRSEKTPSDLRTRAFYGAVVGAVVGMLVGTMTGNDPALGMISMAIGAALISGLAALSKDFWESLRAAWELVRTAFWRW